MGQLTLHSTAVSQSSRATFFTRGWWHVELQPTTAAWVWVDTWRCTCILASCRSLYRCTIKWLIAHLFSLSGLILGTVFYGAAFIEVNSPIMSQVWGSKEQTSILPWLTKDCCPLQGISLWLMKLWHGIPLKIPLSSAAEQRCAVSLLNLLKCIYQFYLCEIRELGGKVVPLCSVFIHYLKTSKLFLLYSPHKSETFTV